MNVARLATLFFLVLSLSLVACKKGDSPEGAGDSSTQPESAVVTGDVLTEQYVSLLCQKYADCGIEAFADAADCKARITALLAEDPQWKALKLDKAGLDTCLADFKNLACGEFKAGQSPPSCDKLQS